MTDEELDKARAEEAWRVFSTSDADFTIEALGEIAARLAREGWTPPVDPDRIAFEAWLQEAHPFVRDDGSLEEAYLAGARMAREQEQTRALAVSDRLAQALKDYGNWDNCDDALEAVLAAYKAERGWGAAR